jgi:hypothetical protein
VAMMEEIGGGGGGEVCVSRSVMEIWRGIMNWLRFITKLFLQVLRGTPQFFLSYICFAFPLLSSSSSFKPLPIVEIPLRETTSKKITDMAHDSTCVPDDVSNSGASDDSPTEKLTVCALFYCFHCFFLFCVWVLFKFLFYFFVGIFSLFLVLCFLGFEYWLRSFIFYLVIWASLVLVVR